MSDDLPSEYDLVVVGTGIYIKSIIKVVNLLIFLNLLNFLNKVFLNQLYQQQLVE